MTILDRYCAKEFIRYLLMIMLAFVGLYLIIDFFEKIRMFVSNRATLYQMLSFVAFNIPMVMWQMLPASVLVAALVSFSSLSRNNEIMAIKACGISLYRLARPIIIIAVVVSGLAFIVSEFVTPYTNQRAKHIKLVEIQKREPVGSFKSNQIWYRAPEGIYNIKGFDTRTNNLWGVTLYQVDHKMRLVKRLDAARAEWREGKWVLYNVVVTTFTPAMFPELHFLSSQTVALSTLPDNLKAGQKDADNMGYMELGRYIREMQGNGYDATSYRVDLYGKLAFPLASIIMAVIGFASALQGVKTGNRTKGLVVGIAIGFSYWIVFAFTISLGHAGGLSPLLAAWSANLLFGLAACFLCLRVRT